MYACYKQHQQRPWKILRDGEDSPFGRHFAARRAADRERARDLLSAGWDVRGLRTSAGYFGWRSLHRQALMNAETVS
jgi:hypothetical protein